ncbi:hypothetical protein [Variovorax sp. MHTC-1]|uniref:hypothetical protein n=1 Tax=Variovorax sp. MHTC-1 TaxID=2495593 RepID=UPI000F85E4E5|nr:hypothetical protein [Variovorax sp. MHTC-1]RST46720.1 hypothetical protein EJI01_28310 [Variovorax sp. MHTC-1]
MNPQGFREYAMDLHQGHVSQACFLELLRVDGEDSASAASSLGSFLRCLKAVVRRGDVVHSYHPKAGEVQLRTIEELDAWCEEFFPCAFSVWSNLVWSSEKRGWVRFGDTLPSL